MKRQREDIKGQQKRKWGARDEGKKGERKDPRSVGYPIYKGL